MWAPMASGPCGNSCCAGTSAEQVSPVAADIPQPEHTCIRFAESARPSDGLPAGRSKGTTA